MKTTTRGEGLEVCSAADEANRTRSYVLRGGLGPHSQDCECSGCSSRMYRRTFFDLYQIERDAKEHLGLI